MPLYPFIGRLSDKCLWIRQLAYKGFQGAVFCRALGDLYWRDVDGMRDVFSPFRGEGNHCDFKVSVPACVGTMTCSNVARDKNWPSTMAVFRVGVPS